MSGLLAEYGVDAATHAAESSYGKEPEPGIYEFEVADVFVKNGSTNDPNTSWLIINYNLEDDMGNVYEKSDLFTLPKDPESPTEDEKTKLGFYVRRLADLGFPRETVNEVGRDDLIGLRGTLQIKSTAGKGKNAGKVYKNISNVKLAAKDTATVETKVSPAKATARKPVNPSSEDNPFA